MIFVGDALDVAFPADYDQLQKGYFDDASVVARSGLFYFLVIESFTSVMGIHTVTSIWVSLAFDQFLKTTLSSIFFRIIPKKNFGQRIFISLMIHSSIGCSTVHEQRHIASCD